MKKLIIISVLLFVFQAAIIIDVAVAADPIYGSIFKCNNTDRFQPNSPYNKNIIAALKPLPEDASRLDGWYINFVGEKPGEQVASTAMCMGYVKPGDCKKCIQDAIPLLRLNCPNQKQAVAWMVRCMVRYSNNQFFGNLDPWFWIHATSDKKIPDTFFSDKALEKLLIRVTAEAAGGGRSKKFSMGEEKYNGGFVYMAAQCTPDLSTEQCNQCFLHMFKEMKPCCSTKTAAAMMSPNCIMRYSHGADFRGLM